MGVAVATSVAQVVQNVSQLLLAHRRLGIWTHVSFSWAEVREFFRPSERSESGGVEPPGPARTDQ